MKSKTPKDLRLEGVLINLSYESCKEGFTTSDYNDVGYLFDETNKAQAQIRQMVSEATSLKYQSKVSRQYNAVNSNPNKAHENGYRLAIREIKANLKEQGLME